MMEGGTVRNLFEAMSKHIGAWTIAILAAGAQAEDNDANALGILGAAGERGRVLVMPQSAPADRGGALVDGMGVEVYSEGGFVVYRVRHEGRTHTAYNPVSGTRRWLAFEPEQRRFKEVAPSILVRMTSLEELDALIDRTGALDGKAYPAFGWALLRFGPTKNPADAAARLTSDASVRSARLLLRDDVMVPVRMPRFEKFRIARETRREGRTMPRTAAPANELRFAAPAAVSPATPNTEDSGTYPQNAKNAIAPDLLAILGDAVIDADRITIDALVYNWGAVKSTETAMVVAINDQPRWDIANYRVVTGDVPEIDSRSGVGFSIEVPLNEIPPNRDYYVIMQVDEIAAEHPGRFYTNQDFKGFSLDANGRLVVSCRPRSLEPGFPGTVDPLADMQWHLTNTGQRAFANEGGEPGEDLDMARALAAGHSGNGVRIAIADTGLEVCHGDLAANVEPGASYNVNVSHWSGALASDPFNFSTVGDHGTSVAGVAAAVLDNGVGGRGVASEARLRGYNVLEAIDWARARTDSLGGSSTNPNSTDVDIFNLSFGSLGIEDNSDSETVVALYRNGVTNLRDGLGAIYVKSAGNGFQRCRSMSRSVNTSIGCLSSNSDPTNNLPYLIVVSAFNASGERASYSGVGANLWISAPAGQYGNEHPAIITTDQRGHNRGYDVLSPRGLSLDDSANANGDYVSSFNGTSAAAPNASGAIALLLAEYPGLTWRDVKHILAKTARQIDPHRPEVRYGSGGAAYLLEEPWADEDPAERARNWYRFGAVPYTLQLPWVTNAAGYAFHNWYGFGALSVDGALEFAASYKPDSLGEFTETDTFGSEASADIPDFDSSGRSQSLVVDGLSAEADIEAVTLEIEVTHPNTNDLGIHLVSPSGTESILNPVFNEVLAGNADLDWHLLSNAFYGESPNGEWTLKVVDAAPGDSGTLNGWRLRFALGVHPD